MKALSEIDTTTKRASRAAGFPWGIAEEIGKNIISEVLPYLFKKDYGRISRATTTSQGKFTSSFSYLKDFIK